MINHWYSVKVMTEFFKISLDTYKLPLSDLGNFLMTTTKTKKDSAESDKDRVRIKQHTLTIRILQAYFRYF